MSIVTVSDENYLMNGTLHSVLTGIFLLGIYTVIYTGTMFICLRAKNSRNPRVLMAITALYILNVISCATLWEDIQLLIGTKGGSKTSSLVLAAAYIDKHAVIFCTTQTVPLIVADGLLIWRCYRIWNNSRYAVALSLIVFLAETALYIYVVKCLLSNQIDTPGLNPNKALSVGFFLTLGLTLWTTILISYRIYSTSTRVIQKHSRTRFKNILEMLIQSSAMYSLVLLANAVSVAIPTNESNIWTIGVMGDFLGVILHAITGIAPTLMVCRVALASSSGSMDSPTTINISGIDFGAQHPNGFRPGGQAGVGLRTRATNDFERRSM